MTTDPRSLSRREFTALSIAAGVAAATRASAAATIEQPLELRMPSGVNDAYVLRPEGKGPWPAVILFTDAFGLRPAMRDMARRLAAEGYVVLVPNPYYRATKAPGIDASTFDFSSPADRAKLQALRAPLTNAAVAQDATTYLQFLDAQPFVNKTARAGAFGYCMGGLMTLQAAAGVPSRIGAGASFHGGGLVTDKPDSPHLFVPKLQGEYLIAIAANDDQAQPDAKTKLSAAFRTANIPAKVEVYAGTLHGWCVKDMPVRDGKPIYNEAEAERAWGELVALFKRRLV